MAVEDLERLKAVYAELANGNLRAGIELFAPDISYEPIADGRETLSREGSVRFMREFVAQWDDFRIEAKAYEQLGNTILVTERQSGTGKASGIEIDMRAYAAWTFRDGLVTRARWSLDRADALDRVELEEPSENAEAVRRLYEEGWSKGDFRAGSELWDPDIECVVELGGESLDFSGSTRGVEAMAEMWSRQLSAWEDYNTGPIEDLIDAGDTITVVSRHWGRGKHSGIEVTNPERVAIFTFQDGKVVRLVLTSRERALEGQQADE